MFKKQLLVFITMTASLSLYSMEKVAKEEYDKAAFLWQRSQSEVDETRRRIILNTAIALYRKAAEQGNNGAKNDLGVACLQRSQEAKTDQERNLFLEEAHLWLSKASQEAETLYYLGWVHIKKSKCCLDAKQTIHLLKEGCQFLEKSAAQGHQDAKDALIDQSRELARNYFNQALTSKDLQEKLRYLDEALTAYKTAVLKDDAIALYNIGIVLTEKSKCYQENEQKNLLIGEAKKYFERAADQDFPDAHCILANNLLKRCKGLSDRAEKKKLMEQAEEFYKKAVAKKHANSFYCYALFHQEKSMDLPEEQKSECLSQSVELYIRAAHLEHPQAQCNLGCICTVYAGRSEDVNEKAFYEKQAVYWFDRAAKSDLSIAQYNLGVLAEEESEHALNENERERLLLKAKSWYGKAKQQDMSQACEAIEKINVLLNQCSLNLL